MLLGVSLSLGEVQVFQRVSGSAQWLEPPRGGFFLNGPALEGAVPVPSWAGSLVQCFSPLSTGRVAHPEVCQGGLGAGLPNNRLLSRYRLQRGVLLGVGVLRVGVLVLAPSSRQGTPREW